MSQPIAPARGRSLSFDTSTVRAPITSWGYRAERLRLELTWPLVLSFAAYPLWWLLGLSAFVWSILLLPLFVSVVWHRWSRAPTAFLIWVCFLAWVLLSASQLTGASKYLNFTYRFSLYAAGALLFLYVYNLPYDKGFDEKVLRLLTIFWIVVLVGGYAGLLFGSHTFTPPLERLLPHGLRSNPFVQELIQPTFAQVQSFLGFPDPRPTAPFTYTNQWGGTIAVLTPVAFAFLARTRSAAWRKLVTVLLILSVIPMAFSLNRAMFLSIGIGVVYVSIRLAFRGRIVPLASILTVVAIVVIIVVLSPLGHLVTGSFSSTHGNSNSTRESLSQLTIRSANSSPWFGYGTPQSVPGQTTSPAIGTQGQLWTVLYSNGYPALLLFLAFGAFTLWQTRAARGTDGLWLHAVLLVALAQIAFYGWLPAELQVVMVAAALAYRSCGRGGQNGQPTATITGGETFSIDSPPERPALTA